MTNINYFMFALVGGSFLFGILGLMYVRRIERRIEREWAAAERDYRQKMRAAGVRFLDEE